MIGYARDEDNYYKYDGFFIGNSDGLKQHRYKYTSSDGRYYILAIHFAGEIRRETRYSEYLYDNNELVGERNNVMPFSVFREIMFMENWIENGYEEVISR